MKARLIRLIHPLAGAAVSIVLAILMGLAFGGIGGPAAMKYYVPIGIGGAVAGWAAATTRGSLEKRLFVATMAGTAVGTVCAVRFLKGEAVDTISALALGLTFFLSSGLSTATALVLPEPAARPPMDPIRRRKLLSTYGCIIAVSAFCWWLPLPHWRAYWNLDIQEAAIRYLDEQNQVGGYSFKINGQPLSKELLRRMPELRNREQIPGEEYLDPRNGSPQCKIGNLRWRDAVTVDLDVDVFWAPDAAGGTTLVLQLTPSGWKVIDDITRWIT